MARRVGVAVLVAMLGGAVLVGCGGGGGSVKVPDTPDGTVKAVADSLAAGKPQVLWAAMPASYQKDVDGLVKEFASKMDAELYDKGFALAKKLTGVLKKQQKFVVGSPMMAKSGIDAKKAEAKMAIVLDVLGAITSSDIATVDGLKKVDIGTFLAGTGAKVMGSMSSLSELSPGDEYNKEFLPALKGLKVEIVETKGDAATLKITPEGKKAEDVKMVKVEGKWIPEEMATDWKEGIAEAKKGLAEMSGESLAEAKPMVIGIMAMVDATLDKLEKAETQEAFDAIIGQAMGGIMGGGGGPRPGPMPGPAPAPAPAPPTPAPAK